MIYLRSLKKKPLQKGSSGLSILAALLFSIFFIVGIIKISFFLSQNYQASQIIKEISIRALKTSQTLITQKKFSPPNLPNQLKDGYSIFIQDETIQNPKGKKKFQFSIEVSGLPQQICELVVDKASKDEKIIQITTSSDSKTFQDNLSISNFCLNASGIKFYFFGDLKPLVTKKSTSSKCSPPCVYGTCNSGSCTCNSGYGGEACNIAICEPECTYGTCIGPNQCSCKSGYTGDSCEIPICTIPCGQGICTAPNVCTCRAGFFASMTGSEICIPCGSGYTSPSGSITQNACRPCGAGEYSNISTGYLCMPCPRGTSSSLGSTYCDICMENHISSSKGCLPCIHGTSTGKEDICSCMIGWTGPQCETCEKGYTGKDCSICENGYAKKEGVCSACTLPTPYVNNETNSCVECLEDTHCQTGFFCIKGSCRSYVQDGLILHYDGINNSWGKHEVITNEWQDLSFSKNNGKKMGGYWAPNGWLSSSDEEYIETSFPLKLNDFTFEIVLDNLKRIGFTRGSALIHNSFLKTDGGYWIGLSGAPDNLLLKLFISGSPNDFIEYKLPEFPKKLSLTAKKEEIKIYINGQLVATLPKEQRKLFTINTPIRIGLYKNEDQVVNALYQSVRVYNRALSEEEILENFSLTQSRYP